MDNIYEVSSTSSKSADVNDIALTAEDDSKFRKIVRSEIVDNTNDSDACVKISLIHQRRYNKSLEWQDADSFSAAKLKGGEEVKFNLNSGETLRLYKVLTDLYAVGENRIPSGLNRLTVVDSELAAFADEQQGIIKYLSEQSPEFWDSLSQVNPDLMAELSRAHVRLSRRSAVETFGIQIAAGDWAERDWDGFFKENSWIFGGGLTYQFLSQVIDQPNYGGTSLDGSGAQRGDFLMASLANIRFTVLVEIKKPETSLVLNKRYRSGVFQISDELTGAVSQMQANCHTWMTEGSRRQKTTIQMHEGKIFSFDPKGILVIGNTKDLAEDAEKISTFEFYRRTIRNPEIVTYDELLSRASFLISEDCGLADT